MYEFKKKNVNDVLQKSLGSQLLLAPKHYRRKLVFSNYTVEDQDIILANVERRFESKVNVLLYKTLKLKVHANMRGPWQQTKEIQVLDWIITVLVGIFEHAKSVTPNAIYAQRVNTPIYINGKRDELNTIEIHLPAQAAICSNLNYNAVRHFSPSPSEIPNYTPSFFMYIIGMMAQHWDYWSGDYHYPIPASYAACGNGLFNSNLHGKITKLVTKELSLPLWLAEQLIEEQQVALIPYLDEKTREFKYKNHYKFQKINSLTERGLLVRARLAATQFGNIASKEISYFDGVQGDLRLKLLQFMIDNLIAYRTNDDAKLTVNGEDLNI